MARLPQVGGDSGDWGDILNDYLSQVHQPDGTLKSGVVTAGIVADNSITESKLDPSVKSKLNASSSASIADGSVTKQMLASPVQASLDKADSALQSSDITSKADDTAVVHKATTETISGAKDFTGGITVSGTNVIVATDTRLTDSRTPSDNSVSTTKIQDTAVTNAKLSTATQSSLAKADSAIQSVTAGDSTITIGGSATSPTVTVTAGQFAPLASPDFTGSPTAPTPTSGDNPTKLATTAFVHDAASSSSLNLAALAAAQPFIVELPENHGAVHDNSTDDTNAIKTAVANAVSRGIADGSYYAEVWFSSGGKPYFVGGALDTSQSGRAQIPLPKIDAHTNQKFVLVLKGVTDGSALAHWQQTSPQTAGATLRTNLNAAYDSSLGSAACIGGPTAEVMAAAAADRYSNMLVVIDGLAIQSPANPRGVAVDLQCVAQAHIKSLGLTGSVAPGTSVPVTGNLTSGGVGLRMPQTGNNDNCEVGTLSVEGYNYGFIPSEHTHVGRAAIIYCGSGIYFQASYPDSCQIDYLSTEVCTYHIDSGDVHASPGSSTSLNINTWDIEDNGPESKGLAYHIRDSNNYIFGNLHYTRNNYSGAGSGEMLLVDGGANARYINFRQPRGSVTAPSLPSTGTALRNPFDRDAAVNFAGGTITAIAIDGSDTGLSGAGTVIVPSGKTITPTYTGTPTWNWTLL